MDIRPGDIQIYLLADDFDPIGHFITGLEGDTAAKHVTWHGNTGKLWTTGVGLLLRYGDVDPKDYLTDKYFINCRFDSLGSGELGIMQAAAESLRGKFYGWWKLALLKLDNSLLGGRLTKLTPFKPNNDKISSPFCSQAVAFVCWKAGKLICQNQGKVDTAAVSPANILAYALTKGTDLNIVACYKGGDEVPIPEL